MTPESVTNTVDSETILAALDEPIEPVKLPLLYRGAVAIVALTMVLLPILYLALVASLGWAVYWHATENVEILSTGSGNAKGRGLIYVGPIFAGAMAIFFLLKPFFARRVKPPENYRVDPEKEPFLFQFVERLCRCVGAPTPSRIDLDIQVNASARLTHGFRSIFTRDLTLTIGLPLAAGMSLRQLAGILAHEFGHFSQGTGMGLTYVIRTINHWFARVVYERDSWDERLDQWAREYEGFVFIVLKATQAMVWVTRRVLWAFMWLGRAVSGFLSRQMEFDADRYEARLVGGDTFESTVLDLNILSVANGWAESDQETLRQERRLCADVPGLVAAQVPQMQKREELMESLHQHAHSRERSLFATHPPDGERIDSAHREETEGVFRIEAPARVLFRDFEKSCAETTAYVYRNLFGVAVKDEQLVPLTQVLAQGEDRESGQKAAFEFFQGWNPLGRRVGPETATLVETESRESAVLRLRDAWSEWTRIRGESGEKLEELSEASSRYHQLYILYELKRGKCGVDMSRFDVPRELAGKGSALRQAQKLRKEKHHATEPLVDAARERLGAGLVLAGDDEIRASLDDSPSLDRLRELAGTLEQLDRVGERVSDLSLHATTLGALFEHAESKKDDEKFANVVITLGNGVREHLWGICNELGDEPMYPYEHASGEVSLQDFIVPFIPKEDEASPGGYWELANGANDRANTLFFRILGDLTRVALQVEAAVLEEAVAVEAKESRE